MPGKVSGTQAAGAKYVLNRHAKFLQSGRKARQGQKRTASPAVELVQSVVADQWSRKPTKSGQWCHWPVMVARVLAGTERVPSNKPMCPRLQVHYEPEWGVSRAPLLCFARGGGHTHARGLGIRRRPELFAARVAGLLPWETGVDSGRRGDTLHLATIPGLLR